MWLPAAAAPQRATAHLPPAPERARGWRRGQGRGLTHDRAVPGSGAGQAGVDAPRAGPCGGGCAGGSGQAAAPPGGARSAAGRQAAPGGQGAGAAREEAGRPGGPAAAGCGASQGRAPVGRLAERPAGQGQHADHSAQVCCPVVCCATGIDRAYLQTACWMRYVSVVASPPMLS